jgi:hypothetical protein
MRQNPFNKFLGPESKLQIAVGGYLKLQYPKVVWLHPPNEGARTKYERYLAKQLGLKAGASDMIILHPNKHFHGLIIELKIAPNKPTPLQNHFLLQLQNVGYSCHVVYTFDDAKSIIDDYMKNK